MKDGLTRPAASAGVMAAVISRLFYGLMVDAPEVHNGAWLSALIGLALALPTLWLMGWRRGKLLTAALLAAVTLDAGAALECAAFSESFVAFEHVPALILMLPLLLAAARCVGLGGNTLGASARIWMWTFVPLMLVVVLYQLPYYRPAWLTPVLGFGMGGILRAGLRAAGWIVTLAGAAMTLCDDNARLSHVFKGLALASLVAATLIALRLIMAPAMDAAGMSRSIQLDALLTNGRAPLYLQLPMIVIWFVGMLHLLCFECWAAMALLRRLFPAMGRLPAGALALVAVAALALTPVHNMTDIWRLPALIIATLVGFRKEDVVCAD